jgi:hypothetical protein
VVLSHPDKRVLPIQVPSAERRKLDGEALLQQLDGQAPLQQLDGQALLQQLDGQVYLLLLDGKVHLPNLDGDPRQNPCPQKQQEVRAKIVLVILVVALSHPDKIVLPIQVLPAEKRKLDGEALLQQVKGQALLQQLDGKLHLPNLDGDPQQNPCPQKQPDARTRMILVILVVEPHLPDQDLSLSHPDKIVLQILVL